MNQEIKTLQEKNTWMKTGCKLLENRINTTKKWIQNLPQELDRYTFMIEVMNKKVPTQVTHGALSDRTKAFDMLLQDLEKGENHD